MFFGFIKKMFLKKLGSHPDYVGSPDVSSWTSGLLGLIKLIASPNFAYLKPDQEPRSPRFQVNLLGMAESGFITMLLRTKQPAICLLKLFNTTSSLCVPLHLAWPCQYIYISFHYYLLVKIIIRYSYFIHRVLGIHVDIYYSTII